MPTSFANGTQTAVINTEHTLASVNQVGTYVLFVDLVNMAAGDRLEIRVKKRALTGGTSRTLIKIDRDGDQNADDEAVETRPIGTYLAETDGLIFTLKQTAGTGRNFPWVVEKYAS